ncbi:MAG: sensor histidine kinase [Bacteroidetes bacterium]|nr:sensor histidine kinase [Bacteroidota bacterium]
MLDRPERIAFFIGILLGPVVWFVMFAMFELVNTDDGALPLPVNKVPYLEITLLSTFIASATAFLAEYLIRKFLYSRLLKIYKFISNPDRYQTSLMADAEEVGKVEMEVASWAQKKTTELSNLQVRDDVRREFIANLSHELHTPIFNIQGYVLTLLDGVKDSKIRKDYLKKASRNVERMIRLVQDMDVLARLEGDQLVLQKERYSLTEQIEDALEQMSDRIAQQGLTVVRDYDSDEDCAVFADPERIDQVVLNLISNAIKYSRDEPGGFLRVAIEDAGEKSYTVLVQDNGIGISKEDLGRVFERFYRGDRSRTRTKKIGGTGLGLAIVKHIVEAHGHAIKVNSTSGEGTTFSFTISKG